MLLKANHYFQKDGMKDICALFFYKTIFTFHITSVYTEFGATSADSIAMTLTYHASGLATAKTFNILARQISCTATYKYDGYYVI